MKGTVAEAELQVLQARLKGGILHKASRAALKVPLPVGLLYAEDQTVILDPYAQIQQALRLLFASFKRTGSAWATVKYFRAQELLFPRRVRIGPHAGELHWMPLQHNAVLKVLRNPRYAGAFCFGRTHTSKHPDGSLHIETLPQEQWLFLIREVHAGYLSMQVYEELHTQAEAARHLRAQQVERARYAAELAQRRFLRVDPENRLVADVLEADWNARLRELACVQEEAEQQNEAEQRKLSALEQQAIADLVDDFPRVWKDPRTSDRDRKRMIRLLLEDVTVLKQEEVIAVHVRFKGGVQQTITVPVSRGRRSTPDLIALIDQLLDDYTEAEVAEQLNQRGWRTYEGKPFSAARVLSLRRYQQLKAHGTRLAERGLLSAEEAASAYGVCRQTIMERGRTGLR